MTIVQTQWLIFVLTILSNMMLHFLLPWLTKRHKDNQVRIIEHEKKLRQLISDNEYFYKQGDTIITKLTSEKDLTP